MGELDHVCRAFPQRRKFLRFQHVEAEQQSSRKDALAHASTRCGSIGRDDADVDRPPASFREPVDHALLDRAQELGLQPRVHLRNLVEQEGAAGGFLELADAAPQDR